jgi:hypothetical protein
MKRTQVGLVAGPASPTEIARRLCRPLHQPGLAAVAWLIIDGGLWDRPDDNSAEAKERSRLYNTSTLVTLTIG